MNRRTFIKSGAVLGTLCISGGVAWHLIPKKSDGLTIDNLLSQLDALQQNELVFTSSWNSFQILTHLAQSVEYSMSGYPEHKSDLFKTTVGTAAFTAFSSKGIMSHNLEESIPGAPELQVEGNPLQALQRLTSSLKQFKNHNGELKEHFAYGELTKAEYEIAHVLHVNDHFSVQVTT